jgi:hypothetical protein
MLQLNKEITPVKYRGPPERSLDKEPKRILTIEPLASKQQKNLPAVAPTAVGESRTESDFTYIEGTRVQAN